MRDRNKNKKISLNDFISYRDDKMKGEERNAFERELQKDLFSKEASEGFASVTSDEASGDIHDLRESLEKRLNRKKGYIIYRIAAAIAVLMIISSLFIVVQIKRPSKQIAMETGHQVALDIPRSSPVIEPAGKSDRPSRPAPVQERKKEIRTEKEAEQVVVAELNALVTNETPVGRNIDSNADVSVKPEDNYSRKAQIAAAPAAAKEKSFAVSGVRGRVISSEDNLPVAGVSIVVKNTGKGTVTDSEGNFSISVPDSDKQKIVASFIGMGTKEIEVRQDTPAIIRLDPDLATLNEIVVTGYGTGRAFTETDKSEEEYIRPQPSVGKDNFDRYVREHIRWPDNSAAHQKVVVVLGFTVHTDGSVDSIKIIKSPGKAFSDEAIRLVRSGPAWKPAREGDNPVEDEVRLRIIFK
jgi:TonB family protein